MRCQWMRGLRIGGTIDGPPNIDAYHAAYLAAAAIAFIGSLMALRVPDSEAAQTMVQRSKPIRKRGSTPVDPIADRTSAGC